MSDNADFDKHPNRCRIFSDKKCSARRFWIDLPLAGVTAEGFAAEQLYQNLIPSEDRPSCDHYLFFPSSL